VSRGSTLTLAITPEDNMKTNSNQADRPEGHPTPGIHRAGPVPASTRNPRSRRPRVAMMALAFIGTLLAACAPQADSTPIPASAMKPRPSGILAAGDEIMINYPGAQELNTTAKIQATGRVSLPIIGEVPAAGRTIGTFQSQLTSRYQPHLQDPQVIVSMDTPASSVYVSGEVRSPGKVPLDRPMTALEAVMETGGFTNLANPKMVTVIRSEDGKHQRYVLNLQDTLRGNNQQAFYLRPFDVVNVGQSRW